MVRAPWSDDLKEGRMTPAERLRVIKELEQMHQEITRQLKELGAFDTIHRAKVIPSKQTRTF